MRHAFANVWDLNVKAMPTSMLWAIAFWFLIESPSILVKIFAVLLANTFALASALIILRLERPRQEFNLLSIGRNPILWKLVHPVGILLVLALHNASRLEKASTLTRYLFVSVVFSTLILWILATLVLIPIQVREGLPGKKLDFEGIGLVVIGLKKSAIFFALLTILFTWPLIFFYAFCALTLAQSLVFGALSDRELEPSSRLMARVESV